MTGTRYDGACASTLVLRKKKWPRVPPLVTPTSTTILTCTSFRDPFVVSCMCGMVIVAQANRARKPGY